MELLGTWFVGTRTDRRDDMTAFCRDVLGLPPVEGHGMDASVFLLPDGSTFAVTSPDGPGDERRTVGFLVADIEEAWSELRAAGVDTDDAVSGNDTQLYLHFTGPDGRLYELVQER